MVTILPFSNKIWHIEFIMVHPLFKKNMLLKCVNTLYLSSVLITAEFLPTSNDLYFMVVLKKLNLFASYFPMGMAFEQALCALPIYIE